MTNFLIFLVGVLGVLVVAFLLKSSKKWYVWFLGVAWYAWVVTGVSFAYLNLVGHHPKAASVGITFFGIIAIILAFVIARVTGFIGKKKVVAEHKEVA